MQLTLLLLPVAAGCSWYLGKREGHTGVRQRQSKMHKDYFKGLNFLINEQSDKAVDVFINLLEVDGDTVDTHLALGNLFRRRGEVDRAIRIHQNLIARPQLEQSYRLQALAALGQDYLSAGVLDRAERLFLDLIKLQKGDQNVLRFLLRIYQQEKEWGKAIQIARRLDCVTGEPMRVEMAQFYCELAESELASSQKKHISKYLKQAIVEDKLCVRANILGASIAFDNNNYKMVIDYCHKVSQQNIEYLPEVLSKMYASYLKLDRKQEFSEFLGKCIRKCPRLAYRLCEYDYLEESWIDGCSREFILETFENEYSLIGLGLMIRHFSQQDENSPTKVIEKLYAYMKNLLVDRQHYRCSQCGFISKSLLWSCPSCHSWVTMRHRSFTDT